MESLRRAGRKGEGVFHRNQEGASALEFALVLPILVVLIFGAFSVALGFNLRLASAHAVRDASRYAATLELPFDDAAETEVSQSWFEEVRDRTIASSNGQLLANGADDTTVCVAIVEGDLYRNPSGTVVNEASDADNRSRSYTFVAAGGSWSTPSADTDYGDYCFVDGLQPSGDGLRVQVSAQRPFAFNIVFLPLSDITIRSTSIADYEELLFEIIESPTPTPSSTST
jgi:Flp pilus assembly protein TadG